MKHSQLFWFGVLGFACSACGSSPAPAPAAPRYALTRDQIKPFLVSDAAPCLSAEKLFARANSSTQSRYTLTDAQVPADGTLVSQAFFRSVITHTDLSATASALPALRQDGCESISLGTAAAPLEVKLARATPTQLITERFWYQSPGEAPQYSSLAVELVAPGRFVFRQVTPYVATHDRSVCGFEEEVHEVQLATTVEFGAKLGAAAPAISLQLGTMKKQSAVFDDPRRKEQVHADEVHYCQLAVHSHH